MTVHPVGCVLVCGAGSGIGAAVARAALRHADRVVACSRRRGPLGRLATGAAEDRLLTVVADLTEPEEVERTFDAAVERFGAVTGVVHSVGVEHPVGWSRDLPLPVAADVVDSLVTSPALVLLEAIRRMSVTGGVAVVVSSGAAAKGTPGRALYGPAKAAVNQLVLSLAPELAASEGPRTAVVAIQPGRVDTPMQRALVRAAATAPALFGLASFSDLAGVRQPEVVAEAVHELLHRSPEELNGQVLRLTADGWQAVR